MRRHWGEAIVEAGPRKNGAFQYDVALSFAGQDRQAAAELARMLTAHKVRVFYDRYE